MLNLGVSYDYYFNDNLFLRGAANFTSNAFSRDQVGAGIEFSVYKKLILRGAYKYDIGSNSDVVKNVYTGLSAGMTVETPIKKGSNNIIGIDYAYRTTNPFKGTHNLGIRFGF